MDIINLMMIIPITPKQKPFKNPISNHIPDFDYLFILSIDEGIPSNNISDDIILCYITS
jgi:hypothetical protein